MSQGYDAGYSVPPLDEDPEDNVGKAIANTLKIHQAEYKGITSLSSRMGSYQKDYLAKMKVLVADGNWAKWNKSRKEHRVALRDAIVAAEPSRNGTLAIEKARKDIVGKGDLFRKSINFDVRKATKIRDPFIRKMDSTIVKAWNIPKKPEFLLTEGPKHNPHPWVIHSPPYPGYHWDYSWYRTDEPWTPSYTRYLDKDAGQLGSYSYVGVWGADDWDLSYVRYRTAFRFWYKMPAAGMFELYFKMQSVHSNFYGDTDDEWGWSDVSVKQYSRPYVRVVSPTVGQRRFGNYLFYYYENDEDSYWYNQVAPVMSTRWAYVLSEDAYAANKWLLVEAGLEDYNYFFSNDVTVDSTVKQKWFVPEIWIRKKD